MKIIYLSIVSSLLFTACATQPAKNETKQEVKQEATTQMVGNDVDEHGCKPSAGYQWSQIKNDCIRVFEAGIRLNPKDANLDQTTSAFVVFKSETEMDLAEIFIPTEKISLILKKQEDKKAPIWMNEKFNLSKKENLFTLSDANNKVLYEGTIAK